MSTDEVRIGTADREAAVATLQQAVGDGYLTLQEFDERIAAAYSAKTRGDLKPLLKDLPSGQSLVNPPDAAAVQAGTEALDINWTTVRRASGWIIGPRVQISGSTGAADLDLGAATFSTPGGCEFLLDLTMSTVKLRLTPQQQLRHDQLQTRALSTIKDKRRTIVGGGPVITLLGSISSSTIKVLPANG